MAHITLLSDLGLQDVSVAIARGILMQYVPGIPVADITHDITPFHTRQAAYMLGAAYKSFPAGTYHVVLFDLFSEKTPELLLFEYDGHYFLAPNNGCIPRAIGVPPVNVWLCNTFANGENYTDWLHAAGNVIASLHTKKISVDDLQLCEIKNTPAVTDLPGNSSIDCEVIHIDQYENIVLNVTRSQFERIGAGRQFRLQFMQVEEINEISGSYTDARTGYKLCRFNSNSHMEICINRGKAASLFGLRLNSRNNNIKLIFE